MSISLRPSTRPCYGIWAASPERSGGEWPEIGPNGARKPSFFNIVSDRFPASRGQLHFEGRDITRAGSHQRVKLGSARSIHVTNHLPRDFETSGPNQKWAADFTYIRTAECWLYAAAVIPESIEVRCRGCITRQLNEWRLTCKTSCVPTSASICRSCSSERAAPIRPEAIIRGQLTTESHVLRTMATQKDARSHQRMLTRCL